MESLNQDEVHFSFSECVAMQKPKRQQEKEKYSPEQKIQVWLENLEGFYANNPEYELGIVQVGIPALKTETCFYKISSEKWLENVRVTRTAERGLNWVKASLEEKRNGMTMGKVYVRMHYAQTYYIERGIDGNVRVNLLFANDDWLLSAKVDMAFDIILKKEKGKLLENLDWRTIQYKGYQNIARVIRYQDEKGAIRVLACIANSGAILDSTEDDVEIGVICPESRNFGSPVLRYRRTPTGLIRLKS